MRAVIFVLLAAVLFGTTGTAQALGAPGVEPLSLGSARIVVGGTALALVAFVLTPRARWTSGVRSEGWRGTMVSVLVGAAGVVAYQPAFFLGTERNGVAIGTVVALGSAPIATGLLGWMVWRRFPGWRWCIATAVGVLGLILLASAGASSGGVAGADVLGLVGSLGAGVSYAIYAVMSKRLLTAGWGSASAMAAVFGTAALVSLAFLVLTDTGWLTTAAGSLTVLWLGLVTVCVAYLLFAAGLRSLSAASVSTLTLAEPLTAAILGLVVLGETLSLPSWIGLAAIALGILILATTPRRSAAVAGAPAS
ncbi:MAG TPA: EamA family transporter [Glaciibacter sp.]|nr:EamA family transporter [Glaciibacter sp.]